MKKYQAFHKCTHRTFYSAPKKKSIRTKDFLVFFSILYKTRFMRIFGYIIKNKIKYELFVTSEMCDNFQCTYMKKS